MRFKWLALWYALLALTLAGGVLYAVAALGGEYGRQRILKDFGVSSAHWREVNGVPFAEQINRSARLEGLDARLVAAVIRAESSFQPKAVSPSGANGLMQVIPATWREVNGRLKVCAGRHTGECQASCYFDPELNIRIGTAYLGELTRRYQGDTVRAVAAYNAGPAAVDQYGGIPPFPETEEYVRRVVSYWYDFGQLSPPVYGLAPERWGEVKLVAGWGTVTACGAGALVATRMRREQRSWRWR